VLLVWMQCLMLLIKCLLHTGVCMKGTAVLPNSGGWLRDVPATTRARHATDAGRNRYVLTRRAATRDAAAAASTSGAGHVCVC
jgi:hypothetical protein